jgi:DNA-binding protein HU-beta
MKLVSVIYMQKSVAGYLFYIDMKNSMMYESLYTWAYLMLINKQTRGGIMTKAELVDQMAKDAGISKVAASAALNSFMGSVTKALKKKDGKVTLVGFGTFSKVRRKARKGRNPQTGAPIKIKATNVVKFKAGKQLKDAV